MDRFICDTILPLANVTKNSVLDVVEVVDSPLSLLGDLSPRCLSVRQRGRLATYGEILRVVRSVLCKIITILTISHHVVIFVHEFY